MLSWFRLLDPNYLGVLLLKFRIYCRLKGKSQIYNRDVKHKL